MTDDENRSARMSRRRKLIFRKRTLGESDSHDHVGVQLDPATLARRAHQAPGFGPPNEIDALELLDNHREVVIIHSGHRYRLRITSANKLILTK